MPSQLVQLSQGSAEGNMNMLTQGKVVVLGSLTSLQHVKWISEMNSFQQVIHEDGMWLPLWLDFSKNMVTYVNISPNMVNPRDLAGNAEKKNFNRCICTCTLKHVADQTGYLIQTQYKNTGPTSSSTDPLTPSTW